MAHEFSYPAKGKPLWSHKWSGAFWLVASFERSCFVVVPKKVITAMSGKYCCWYCYCLVSHWALLVGMGIGMHSAHSALKSSKDCNLGKLTVSDGTRVPDPGLKPGFFLF